MHAYSAWNIDASQILTRGELAQVLADLKRRSPRLPNVQMNLAIIRLASCCGLRDGGHGDEQIAKGKLEHGYSAFVWIAFDSV